MQSMLRSPLPNLEIRGWAQNKGDYMSIVFELDCLQQNLNCISLKHLWYLLYHSSERMDISYIISYTKPIR